MSKLQLLPIWLRTVLLVGSVLACSTVAVSAEPLASTSQKSSGKVSPAQLLANGVRVHSVESAYQKEKTSLRVLLPRTAESGRECPVVYVLPVEPGEQAQYGDPLQEILRLNLHEKHRLIVVAPTFDRMPWFADHPTDPLIRQESHFVNVIVPFIDRTYRVKPGAAGRWLLGFSKGGWGAFSLLLRHPETFDRAAAWDVPFMLPRPDRYGMSEVFGNQENFELYRVPKLLESKKELLRQRPRLALLGYQLFREHHQSVHMSLEALKIPHRYQDGPQRPHRWDSGWLAETVALLSDLPAATPEQKKR